MKTRQEQAVDIAKLFVNSDSHKSYTETISFLREHGFSQELALHGAENCGKNWIQAAVQDLNYMIHDMHEDSYDYLCKQLLSSGYSETQVYIALERCDIDWDQEAILDAEDETPTTEAFSRDEMITYLQNKYCYFGNRAVNAVNNCKVDWNAHAKKAIDNLLKKQAYSCTELINELEEHGFYIEQIVEAFCISIPDWNKQAKKAADEYIALYRAVSVDDLSEFLVDKGFHDEQVQYAIEQSQKAIDSRVYKDVLHCRRASYTETIQSLMSLGYETKFAKQAIDQYDADHWNEVALDAAEKLLDKKDITSEQLLQLLVNQGFTKEQSLYAVNNSHIGWEAKLNILQKYTKP